MMTEEKPEVLKTYVKLVSALGEVRWNIDFGSTLEIVMRILAINFNYELTRELLKLFVWLAQKGAMVEEVLTETLRHYKKLSDIFHQQLMSVFFESFKSCG